jgi:hypothetical protein
LKQGSPSSTKLDFEIFVYPFEEFAKFKAVLPDLDVKKCSLTVIFTKKQGMLYVFKDKNPPKLNENYFTKITKFFAVTDEILQKGESIFQLKYDKTSRFEVSQIADKTYDILIYDDQAVKFYLFILANIDFTKCLY